MDARKIQGIELKVALEEARESGDRDTKNLEVVVRLNAPLSAEEIENVMHCGLDRRYRTIDSDQQILGGTLSANEVETLTDLGCVISVKASYHLDPA
jgi:hypothetical protein